MKRIPRLTGWLLTATLLIVAIALISPQQLPVALYKLALISLAAVVAYWLDRSLFPYARPDSYLCRDWRCGTDEPDFEPDYPVVDDCVMPFCFSMIRRVVIVGAVIVGVALGM